MEQRLIHFNLKSTCFHVYCAIEIRKWVRTSSWEEAWHSLNKDTTTCDVLYTAMRIANDGLKSNCGVFFSFKLWCWKKWQMIHDEQWRVLQTMKRKEWDEWQLQRILTKQNKNERKIQIWMYGEGSFRSVCIVCIIVRLLHIHKSWW